MKKKGIDKGFVIALMYIAGTVLLIIGYIRFKYMQYTEYENAQEYRVVRLNSDKNAVTDEVAYYFGLDNVIYRYDFETKKTERLCESWNNKFVIYEEYVFCVEKGTSENSEYKVHRYNYHTGEDEVLLENMPEISGINVCNGYLVYKIYGESNYYLYPATGYAEEEPIAVKNIFKEMGDKTDLDIQTVTYEGIDIVGRFGNAAGGVEYISLRDESSGMELLPREATLLLDDGRLIWFDSFGDYMQYVDDYDDLEECEIRMLMGSGSMHTSIGSDSEKNEVICLDAIWSYNIGPFAAVPSRSMIQDGDEIICLLRSGWDYIDEYTNKWNITMYGDVLFKWNMKTGESSILYASSNEDDEYTRVIGYKDGNIYLLHNRCVSVRSVDGENQKRLFRIPNRKEIRSFDWQGDYLIVTGADGKVLKAYKVED